MNSDKVAAAIMTAGYWNAQANAIVGVNLNLNFNHDDYADTYRRFLKTIQQEEDHAERPDKTDGTVEG